jgi:hypothetical protein
MKSQEEFVFALHPWSKLLAKQKYWNIRVCCCSLLLLQQVLLRMRTKTEADVTDFRLERNASYICLVTRDYEIKLRYSLSDRLCLGGQSFVKFCIQTKHAMLTFANLFSYVLGWCVIFYISCWSFDSRLRQRKLAFKRRVDALFTERSVLKIEIILFQTGYYSS